MKKIAGTFREAATIAESFGERLAAEGEICWGGMHGWKHMVELLELVGRPQTVGFQASLILIQPGGTAPAQTFCVVKIAPRVKGASDVAAWGWG